MIKSMYAYMKIKFTYQFTGEDNQIFEEKYFSHTYFFLLHTSIYSCPQILL